jgi:catechol 2,3-dioxygenase-like lactoylglutathione lyase family enzyme
MLGQEKLVAMLGTTNAEAARAFFEGRLGLTFIADHPHALIFDSGGVRLMVQKVNAVTPPHGTALGWSVSDLTGLMQRLAERGVSFERFPGMDQDEMGVWRPAGPSTGVAWFKDPDANLLSLSQAEA